MARIRCKFVIQSVARHVHSEGVVVHACAAWDTSPENREFSKATPWGNLHFGVDNPAALPAFLEGGELVPGREFYLDLTPVS
jgi:hypothetical protein